MTNQTYDPALPVEWIHPHPDNPNEGDEKALEESIDELGFFGAITVRQLDEYEFQIIGGEHRWKVTKAAGGTTIPAIIAHDVDDEKALKMLLVDNEITRRGKYNNEKLAAALRKLPNTRGTGFPMDALEAHERQRAREAAQEEQAAKEFAREYGVVITVASEAEQEALYEALQEKLGLEVGQLRVVSI
jgi:predicted mannosyl-3-phosphoglycerate phosphatase (HAD superfamily)